jgi:hypothetical protein
VAVFPDTSDNDVDDEVHDDGDDADDDDADLSLVP